MLFYNFIMFEMKMSIFRIWKYIVFSVSIVITSVVSLQSTTIRLNSYVIRRLVMSSMTDNEDKTSSTLNVGAVTVLRCDGLTKSYTGTPQFQDISFTMGRGQRIGLIGVNGAGKSTFLKCLAKKDTADSGSIDFATNTNTVYVDQEPDWGNKFVYEALFDGESSQAIATRQYMKVTGPYATGADDELSKALDKMEEAQAWDYQTMGFSIAEKLNIREDKLYRNVNTLSGGEKKRVGLSAALLLQPDILLLDEPTNHLDADALEWLADFLKPGGRDKDMTMLLVTHDRYFLERVCSEIVELDRAQLYRYPGNYARYIELKASRLAAEDAETERARTKLRRESEWMAKQPRARQAKSKARQDQFYELVEQSKGRIDTKAIILSSPEDKEKQRRLGGVIAEFKGAEYEMHGQKLLKSFTYNFRQRDRIGICGPNGVGKSTFLKILVGELKLSAGMTRLGETVRIGYYEQVGLRLTLEQEKQPVLKFIQEAVEMAKSNNDNNSNNYNSESKSSTPKLVITENSNLGRRKMLAGKEPQISVQVQESYSSSFSSSAVSEKDAMQLLSKFQFPSKRWYDRVGQLSGGERRRLQLLQVLAKAPNFLVLDEPSNDLDLQTLTTLEEYLTETFDGCLVIVSHDNFFVNRVCEHLFVFEGDGIVRDFQGSYTDYLEYRRDLLQSKREEALYSKKGQSSQSESIQSSDSSSGSGSTKLLLSSSSSKVKLSSSERKEYNKLEKEISKLSTQINEIEQRILSSGNTVGYSILADWQKEVDHLRMILSTKEEKWMNYALRDA